MNAIRREDKLMHVDKKHASLFQITRTTRNNLGVYTYVYKYINVHIPVETVYS